MKRNLTLFVEENSFDCDMGYFLDIDHFVRIWIQENRIEIIYMYRKYLHKGCFMSFTFLWSKYLFLASNLVPHRESEEHSFPYLRYFL